MYHGATLRAASCPAGRMLSLNTLRLRQDSLI
jgi:hypothetical protein